MGNVTTGSNYSNTTKYTTTPNGKTFKIEVENGGIVDYSKPNKMSGVLKALGAKGVDLGAQIASGYISDYFNQRSENRADERNRRLIKDTPLLQVEGRRKAGLNPYTTEGAQLPGMSAQSQTDTSSNSDFLNDLMMQERFELDRQLAESQIAKNQADANKANADADASRGTEQRAQEGWEPTLRELYAKAGSSEAQERIANVQARIAEYGEENEKALNDLELQQATQDLNKTISEIKLLDATEKEKLALIEKVQEEKNLLVIQQKLARKGIELTLAQTKQALADVRLKASQKALNEREMKVFEANKKYIDAKTQSEKLYQAEIPKNARASRFASYVDSATDIADSCIDLIGAFATGGVSAGASSIVRASNADLPPGVVDMYGNPIRNER